MLNDCFCHGLRISCICSRFGTRFLPGFGPAVCAGLICFLPPDPYESRLSTGRRPSGRRDLPARAVPACHISFPPGGSGQTRMACPCGTNMLFAARPLRKQAFDGPGIKKAPQLRCGAILVCGESEIRTREPLLTTTRFPGVPLQPLEHLSSLVAQTQKTYFFHLSVQI